MPARFFPLERGLLEISGKDRGNFLQGLYSQDTARNFPVGKAVYGVFANVKGKIIADAYLAHADSGRFFLDVEAFAADSLRKHLDRYLILMEATLRDVSSEYRMVAVPGPDAAAVIGKAFAIPELRPDSCCPIGEGFLVYSNRPRFEEFRCWIRRDAAGACVKRLEENGAAAGSEADYAALQIEAGIPKLGAEMGETTFPQEVGLGEFLNFSKGCFVGAEVLQRIYYQGHVNRALALLALPINTRIPEAASIFQEGKEVGKITRSAPFPERGTLLALVLVTTAALDADRPLEIVAHEGRVLADRLSLWGAIRHRSV